MNRKHNMEISFLIRRHMQEVMDIENKSFISPWTENEMLETVWGRGSKDSGVSTIGLVATVEGEVVGYVVYSVDKESFEVLNFAVRDDMRKRGVGSAILSHLKMKMEGSKVPRTSIIIDVSESNLGCHLFLKKNGFLATGIMKEAYEAPDEDAYRFEWVVFESNLWEKTA